MICLGHAKSDSDSNTSRGDSGRAFSLCPENAGRRDGDKSCRFASRLGRAAAEMDYRHFGLNPSEPESLDA